VLRKRSSEVRELSSFGLNNNMLKTVDTTTVPSFITPNKLEEYEVHVRDAGFRSLKILAPIFPLKPISPKAIQKKRVQQNPASVAASKKQLLSNQSQDRPDFEKSAQNYMKNRYRNLNDLSAI